MEPTNSDQSITLDNLEQLHVLQHLPVEVVVRDVETRIIYANEAFGATYRRAAADVIGCFDRDLWIEHGRKPGEINSWISEDRHIVETGEQRDYIERIERNDGTVVFFHNLKRRLTMPDGTNYMLAVYYDITDQELLEENRRQLELRTAEAEGVHKTAVTYAHKINSPLSGILGLAQLIAEREDVPDDAKAMLREITEAARDIAEVVDKLVSITTPKTIPYIGKTEQIDVDSD